MRQLLFVLALLASTAHAATITIDFEDQVPGDYSNGGLTISGFKFTPGSRMTIHDIVMSRNDLVTNWLGFDAAPHIPGPPTVRVDRGGELFSLLGFFPLAMLGDARWIVTSSKGGFYQNQPTIVPLPRVQFSGPEWTDVEWLLFNEPMSAGGSYGFDDLLLSVADAPVVPPPVAPPPVVAPPPATPAPSPPPTNSAVPPVSGGGGALPWIVLLLLLIKRKEY